MRTIFLCAMRLAALVCVVVLTVTLTAGVASADSILFHDGRFYEVPKATVSQDAILVHYDDGEVRVPLDLVKEYFILDESGAFTPRNDDERAKIAEGLVPYDGKWVTPRTRDRLVAKRAEERQAALDEYQEHMMWRSRYKDSTKHFAFEYTVPKEVADNYRDMFEVFYDEVSKEWGMRQTGPKLKVCFYNNQRDFERIGNVPRGVLGYFKFVEPLELNFFYDRRDERMTLDVLFHEAQHYMMHLYVYKKYKLTDWVSEGLAEYYGASVWDKDKKELSIGHIQEGRLVRMHDAMDGDQAQGLADLMRTPAIDAMQYAWSWSLNHMLLQDRKTASNYRKYVQKMARDRSMKREPWPRNPNYEWVKPDHAIATFQKMLRIDDLEAFEKKWHDYIRSMKVESSRGYYEAGLFCVRWNRNVRATMYFRKALEMGSDNPGVYESLGKVLTRRQKYDEAIETLTKGIEIDPLNAHMHMALGTVYIVSKKDVELGKRMQKLAVEIDPDDNTLLTRWDGLSQAILGG